MENPFIKLIHTPRRAYFYDVNRNELVNISEDLFKFLESRDVQSSEPVKAEYEGLKADGYLSDKRVKVLEHPETLWLKDKADHQMTQLLLQVTQACNLRCKYCAFANNGSEDLQRKHTGKVMTFDTAKKAIDFYLAHSDLTDEIMISFYGGEPIINYALIKQCIEYAEGVFEGKIIRFGITTNATLLTDDIIDYFALHQVLVTVSLDGPKQIHDKNRKDEQNKGTYDLVVKNLKKLIHKYDQDAKRCLGINMVIDPEENLDEIYGWLSQSWLEQVNKTATLADDSQLKTKCVKKDYYPYKEIYEYKLALQYMKQLNILNGYEENDPSYAEANQMEAAYWENLMEHQEELPDTFAPGGPCVPGARKLFVDVEGTFFPCEKVNELCPGMVMGNINEGYDYDAMAKMLNVATLTEDECKNCWTFRYCTLCERCAAGKDGLDAKLKRTFCEDSRATAYRTLRASLMMHERRTLYSLYEESE